MSPNGFVARRGWYAGGTLAHTAIRRRYRELVGVSGDPRHKNAVACAPSPLTGLQLARPLGAIPRCFIWLNAR